MFIETHCHLDYEFYDDINSIVESSKEMGINTIITAGCDANSNKEALEKIEKFPSVYACVGIHPEYANDYQEVDVQLLKEYIKNPKVVALGEIGLDYHYEGYDKLKQIKLLEMQLDLAEKENMPVVIHSRDATEDTINVLKKYHLKGVIHSFSGSVETARIYIKMGYKLGINGVVTFKNAHIKEVIKTLGINHFVLETDSPFLTPEPYRGKLNNPGNIKYIAEFLSNYLNMDIDDIARITTQNAQAIFDKLA